MEHPDIAYLRETRVLYNRVPLIFTNYLGVGVSIHFFSLNDYVPPDVVELIFNCQSNFTSFSVLKYILLS